MKSNFFILESLGYNSFQDFFHTIFLKSKLAILVLITLCGALGIFIEDYIWTDKHAIYFLWTMLLIDLITGITKALFIQKRFVSRKLPRWGGVIFSYMTLLFLAHNMAKFSPELFSFLPTGLYGLFLATQLKSIWENLIALNCIKGIIVTKINKLFKKINEKTEE